MPGFFSKDTIWPNLNFSGKHPLENGTFARLAINGGEHINTALLNGNRLKDYVQHEWRRQLLRQTVPGTANVGSVVFYSIPETITSLKLVDIFAILKWKNVRNSLHTLFGCWRDSVQSQLVLWQAALNHWQTASEHVLWYRRSNWPLQCRATMASKLCHLFDSLPQRLVIRFARARSRMWMTSSWNWLANSLVLCSRVV